MNNIFKPASLLMYLLVFLIFFIVGMTFAGVAEVAKGQGLAGGAVVVFYGFYTAIIALVISLFIAHKTSEDTIIKINKIFGILLLIAVCMVIYRAITLNKTKTPVNKTTVPASKDMSLRLF